MFSGIKLDTWYKVFIPFGGILVLVSLFYVPEFITKKELFILGFGIFLIGIAEWKNVKYIYFEKNASIFNPHICGNIPIRRTDLIGNVMLILGLLAIFTFMLSIFNIITIE